MSRKSKNSAASRRDCCTHLNIAEDLFWEPLNNDVPGKKKTLSQESFHAGVSVALRATSGVCQLQHPGATDRCYSK